MRINDPEWRRAAAKILRDTRRLIDREFAKWVAGHIREMIRDRSGEIITY